MGEEGGGAETVGWKKKEKCDLRQCLRAETVFIPGAQRT